MLLLNRAAIKAEAKEKFMGCYWVCVGVLAVAILLQGACSAIAATGIGAVVTLLVTPVLMAGMNFFFLRVYRGENPEFATLFSSFNNFGHVLGGSMWQTLWTVLWGLVPVMNVIKYYSYCMTPYILMDQPEIGAKDALKVSMAMTQGHKWDIFVMQMSFIGWILLTCCTAGIVGLFYAMPYEYATMAGYYEKLKGSINVKYDDTYSADSYNTDYNM